MGEGRERVAVVATHGVADQSPGETAQAVADLLLYHRKDFEWARQTRVRLPVEPVNPELAKKGVESGRIEPASNKAIKNREGDVEVPSDQLAYEEMEERLEGYRPKGKDSIYETPRVELDGPDGARVHVYEMYWGDLSCLKEKGFGTFRAFFQLLFFVCNLGGRTLKFSRSRRYGGGRLWKCAEMTHSVARACLVLGVPILNLCLLALAVSALLAGLFYSHVDDHREAFEKLLIVVIFGTLLGAGYAYLAWKMRREFVPEKWPLLVFIPLCAGLVCRVIASFFKGESMGIFLPMSTWSAAAALTFLLMKFYERRVRWAKAVAGVIIGVMTIGYFFSFLETTITDSPATRVFEAAVNVFSLAIPFLHWTLWFVISVSVLVFWGIGICIKRNCEAKDCVKAERAVVTGRLSLAVPTLLILIIDLALWQLVIRALPFITSGEVTHSTVKPLFDLSMPFSLWLQVLLAGVAAIMAAWHLIPAILSEGKPNDNSSVLGRTLSAGFSRLIWSECIILVVVAIMIPLGLLISLLEYHSLLTVENISRIIPNSEMSDSVFRFVDYVGQDRSLDGVVVLVVAIGLFLTFVARGSTRVLQSVIDVALDVINWLRFDPKRFTARARITSRFTSLLKALSEWKDFETGQPYDKIVFVAHSQGTVIVADVMRYLKRAEKKPEGLERIYSNDAEVPLPVILFTMGSPLYQLYGIRFPDEYAWARDEDSQDWESSGNADPENLCVDLWSNFYRSGDYVGRSIWQPGAERPIDEPWEQGLHSTGKRRERCIGAGGHTHYWDDTAGGIAEELEFLIKLDCCREAQGSSC